MNRLEETRTVGRRPTRSLFIILGVVGLVVVALGRCSNATSQPPHRAEGQSSPPVALDMAAPIQAAPITLPPPTTTTTTLPVVPARPSPGCAKPIDDMAAPAPLVVLLDDGSGVPGAFVARAHWDEIAQSRQVVLLAPSWTSADDGKFVVKTIADAGSATCFDLARVYLVGFSSGATLGSRIVCDQPGLVAAFVAVAGLLPPDGCAPDVRVPVLAIQGQLDDAVSPSTVVDAANAWARQDGCRPDPFSESVGWDIEHFEFHGCENATDVKLYLVSDMGHEWAERPDDLGDAKRWADLMSTTTIAMTFCENHAR